VVLEREGADALARRGEERVQHRRGGDADGRLADPAPEAAESMMIDSTFGIWAIRIES
jgi:hypothetical protein